MEKYDFIRNLYAINAIKFGNFTLKSSATSNVYVDLRLVVSYPKLLRSIGQILWHEIAHLPFDLLCGVPYTGLPIATCLSLGHDKPMVFRRKEAKSYGSKRSVEGVFQKGQRCLVIEDVVTTGSSVFETIADLEEEGLIVTHVVAFLDREQGAKKSLNQAGYAFYSALTLSELLGFAKMSNLLSSSDLTLMQANPA